jgi:ABC-type Fe3+/spermidine/putrescine transport system ATPase subunit
MSDLSLQNLSKTYAGAGVPALSNLCLDVPSGEMLALLGPSGCGKSTALRLIAGLERPSSGDVRIGGASVAPLPPEARGAVMVFQNHLLFPHMSVAQNVGFGLRMRGANDIAAQVAQMLARVQLSAQADARPAMLSGGQAQRAALARALILRPRVLLLDEPLASLDPHLRAEMRSLIADVQAEMGITTLIGTHDQAEAVQLAPRIALMMQGRLRQLGPARDFYDRPASMAVALPAGVQIFCWIATLASGRPRFDTPPRRCAAASELERRAQREARCW